MNLSLRTLVGSTLDPRLAGRPDASCVLSQEAELERSSEVLIAVQRQAACVRFGGLRLFPEVPHSFKWCKDTARRNWRPGFRTAVPWKVLQGPRFCQMVFVQAPVLD